MNFQRGLKVNSYEPNLQPSISDLIILVMSVIQLRSQLLIPGFGLLYLILVILNCFQRRIDKANAFLNIQPPPSLQEPSIIIISLFISWYFNY
ncbi:unnamed protein product [Paramecium sonneborni]|uniref:Uncharacterized protein n=1 Tax=Paramecium sonneborni TaxID=65129 RepID=A0A8S1QY75_9CILI|nr:unnamed protein product [Paramecium sonneborni]